MVNELRDMKMRFKHSLKQNNVLLFKRVTIEYYERKAMKVRKRT